MGMEGAMVQVELLAFHQDMGGEKEQVEAVVEHYNELVLEMLKAVEGQCSEQVAEVATVVVEHYNEPVQGMVKVEYSKQAVVEEGCSGQGAEMRVAVEQCSKPV